MKFEADIHWTSDSVNGGDYSGA